MHYLFERVAFDVVLLFCVSSGMCVYCSVVLVHMRWSFTAVLLQHCNDTCIATGKPHYVSLQSMPNVFVSCAYLAHIHMLKQECLFVHRFILVCFEHIGCLTTVLGKRAVLLLSSLCWCLEAVRRYLLCYGSDWAKWWHDDLNFACSLFISWSLLFLCSAHL